MHHHVDRVPLGDQQRDPVGELHFAAGAPVDALTGGSDAGLGTLSGTVIGSVAGSAVGAAAGGAAASLIFSGAGALGFIESDSAGRRVRW